jgi:hypothetical protein
MKIKVGFIVIAVMWALLPLATAADVMLFENPETQELTVPAYVITKNYGTPAVETAFYVRNIVEVSIFMGGMLVGMKLGKREVDTARIRRFFAPR